MSRAREEPAGALLAPPWTCTWSRGVFLLRSALYLLLPVRLRGCFSSASARAIAFPFMAGKGKALFGSQSESARASGTKLRLKLPSPRDVLADTREQLRHATEGLRARDAEVEDLNATVAEVRVVFVDG